MSTFKRIDPNDVKFAKSQLNQLIDVLQSDISGSTSRRKYQHFITGGIGPGITSSLFQTVYDQDFTLQTANAVFDMTVGLWPSGSTVASSSSGIDSMGKELFPSQSVMMREKMDIYRQFAQTLIGNAESPFTAPYSNPTTSDQIDSALFLSFKRLFARDQIKAGTFALKFYPTASLSDAYNLYQVTDVTAPKIFVDSTSATNSTPLLSIGGRVGDIVDSAATSNRVGVLFYDAGVAVLDLKKVTDHTQAISGTINAINSSGQQLVSASLIPNLITSASIDNIVDHFGYTRFSSGSLTAVTFQNVTNINSTLIFCRVGADEFNYSSNPTYVNSDGSLAVIENLNEPAERSFTFITTVGLYDANQNLLAVAKLSRPVEKNIEKDLTLRVRLDF